jgi:alkylation response protein AidB-like acyl-CoA dehydrogenase
MEELFSKTAQMGPLISTFTEEEEKNRRLSAPVLKKLKEAGFLRLFQPASLGGLETDPVTVAKLVEEVARHNTAAGWSMMVANVATWWCSRLLAKGIEEIYQEAPDIFIAGAFHPPMRAVQVEGGFRINGRSPLTSNVHEAMWIFVTAMVMEGDKPKMYNGIPVVIGVIMRPAECRIIDTWHTLGMKATDSNDIAAEDVFVPEHRHFILAPEFEPNQYFTAPLYRFPAIGAGVASLIVPVALAVAGNAIEELKTLASKKTSFGSVTTLRERGAVQSKLGKAEALVQSSRAYLHQTLSACWEKTMAGDKLSLGEKSGLLLASVHANQSCLRAADLMYTAAGTTGIYYANKLAHYFLDAQVIRQHGFANESRYETAAQVLLGLQPDLPVLAF